MADKTITDRWKSFRIVASVIATSSGKATARLTEMFTPVLAEGEQLPDWQFDQELKLRLIEQLWQALDESHDALVIKRRELRRLRRALKRASEAVYDRLLDLKSALGGIRPRPAWLKGKLPRLTEHHGLLHSARVACGHLRQMKPQRTAAAELDPASWCKALETVVKTLDAAIDKETLARREAEGQVDIRRQRLEEFGAGFVLLAGELEALYKLAGMDEAARTVQPSKKYPGRTAAEMKRLGKAGGKRRSKASVDGKTSP